MSDTPTRSLTHWSEAHRAGMDAFYTLATVDYRHLAEAADWHTWLSGLARQAGERRLRLLDVACGSGKFPSALGQYAGLSRGDLPPIDYALLDPSAFSVGEARRALKPPFSAAQEYVCTLQDLDCEEGAFDIVWATHALYALPRHELRAGLERFLHAMGRDGAGVIAHAARAAHYLTFHDLYLKGFERADSELYITGEEIIRTLTELGVEFTVRDLTYENGAPDTHRSAVEGYLQRCVFDDTLSLQQMLDNPVTGPYLRTCFHNGTWRFSQTVKLIALQGTRAPWI